MSSSAGKSDSHASIGGLLVEVDVLIRQSYVMAMVRPEERTFASGITHLALAERSRLLLPNS